MSRLRDLLIVAAVIIAAYLYFSGLKSKVLRSFLEKQYEKQKQKTAEAEITLKGHQEKVDTLKTELEVLVADENTSQEKIDSLHSDIAKIQSSIDAESNRKPTKTEEILTAFGDTFK